MLEPVQLKNATRCGAKTRSGAPGKSPAVRGRKRCRMHGGQSRKWIAHPNYKHGQFSKYSLLGPRPSADKEARQRLREKKRSWRERRDALIAAYEAWVEGGMKGPLDRVLNQLKNTNNYAPDENRDGEDN